MASTDSFPARKPQFFKILLENMIKDRKLGIPDKFVKEHGRDLPEYVTLEVPDGTQWKIKLTKSKDGKVCMQQGWLEFSKHYSLTFGNLLVFNPDEVSKFHVVIFDMTGTEIRYAPMPPRNEHFDREFESRNNEKREDARKDLPLPSSRPNKRKRTNKSTYCESGSTADGHMSSIRRYQPKDDGGGRPLHTLQKAELLRKTREFQSRQPYFKVIIQPSAVHIKKRKAALSVPANFAREYFTNNKLNIIIRGMNGKTWSVTYNCLETKFRSYKYKLFRFRGGWGKFAEDNFLKVGDVCIFEMINRKNMTFKVNIIRKSTGTFTRFGNDNCAGSPITGMRSCLNFHEKVRKSTKNRNEANNVTEEYPRFSAEMKCAYLQGGFLNIPKSFARSYVQTGASITTLNVEGKSWQVYLFKHQDGSCRISSGWPAFVRENSLKLMDICNFEMINRRSINFKVNIFRKSTTETCFPSPGNSTHSEHNNRSGSQITGRQSCPNFNEELSNATQVKNEADNSTMIYPRFSAEMQYAYLRAGFLNIPRSFAKSYIKTGSLTTTLNVEGKSWQVKLVKHRDRSCRISTGWPTFVRENFLKLRDICNFELIQNKDFAFRVSISRNK